MPARAYWKGQIRLALVSIPVEIYSATKSGAAVSFRQIHEPSGKPVKYEKTVPGIGAVDHDDIVKGFELSKGNYVLLDEEEIEAVKLESKRTLELVQFVDAGDIDILYYAKPYYVVPADELAEEAYIVLREALRRTKKVGLGQLSLRGQEQLVALRPCGKGLVLEALRYADEVNKAANYFRDVGNAKPDADLLDLAETLIEKKSGAFDASDFRNHYVDAIERLVAKKAKAKGKRVLEDVEEPATTDRGSNVIDLMAALKASVDGKKKPPAAAAKKAPAKKPAARKRA
ncbi:non-homologous end joining protein Ku [Sphingopyxis sp. RIFCSPHIGHO2_12_FULL_65_19]|uniref:non-homologous end joining protein Ku n=1 Tax=Sphingopyxis sp. RIFCSPHIGHO2_12_FULL_65_19 TaxID=1802172 RepID=UPI0008BE8566|nr:Ku protein [Sphingopyxis sp. RIFCSPHIGHO2_12_FULL_65_19]OHD06243.1 MAG: Ku protein [Sphingopyxis sp. RIFCSPHIGHO2_12_FULL_65_19]